MSDKPPLTDFILSLPDDARVMISWRADKYESENSYPVGEFKAMAEENAYWDKRFPRAGHGHTIESRIPMKGGLVYQINTEPVCECGHIKSCHSVTLTDHPDYHDSSDGCSVCLGDDGQFGGPHCRGFEPITI